MASLTRNLLFAALFAVFLSLGHCAMLSCYQGTREVSEYPKEKTNCTADGQVCARFEYSLEGKTYIRRDCVSPQHVGEKINGDREILMAKSKRGAQPSLLSVVTCSKNLCNSASWLQWSWGFILVAATVSVFGATR